MTSNSISSVERKIYFYRANVGRDESGALLPFDPGPALSKISNLPFTEGDGGRYESDLDGNVVCLFYSHVSSSVSLQFSRVRRNGLPQLERAGNLSELLIPSDSGLSEPIHAVFFPENVVGIEYNHFGPRPSRLASYLYDKSNQAILPVSFERLLYRDVADQINNLADLRLLEFRIRSSYANVVRDIDNSLGDALEASAALLDNLPVVEVIARIPQEDRQNALDRFIDTIRRLLGRNDLQENAEQFKVRGLLDDTGKVQTVDLLKSHIVSTKGIVRLSARGRAVDPNSVFHAIHEGSVWRIGR